MFKRISIFNIIRDHLKTLRRIDTVGETISVPDFCLFFLLPVLIASFLIYRDVSLEKHITDLITSVSILGGFLFNLLAIVYGLMDKLQADAMKSSSEGRPNLKATFAKEIHTNISFNIVVSLVMLFLLLGYTFTNGYNVCLISIQKHCWMKSLNIIQALSWSIYCLLGTFSLTMLMILNRIYILLNKN
jgi:hypothetical protein